MQNDLKEHLERLESRLTFNENYIDELNEVVIMQQKTIDKLVVQVAHLAKRLQSMQPSHIVSQNEETPPPHY